MEDRHTPTHERKMMKHLAIFLLYVCPLTVLAHPCPYDWNIRPSKQTTITAPTVIAFAEKFNAFVQEETEGRVQHGMLIDPGPGEYSEVPSDSPFADAMDILIERSREASYGPSEGKLESLLSKPVSVTFPSNIWVACLLCVTVGADMDGMYEETAEGAVVGRWPRARECRAYKVSEALLQRVEEKQRAGEVPSGLQAVPIVFAEEAEIAGTSSAPGQYDSVHMQRFLKTESIYLPDRQVIVILSSPYTHRYRIASSLRRKGYWEDLNTGEESTLPPEGTPSPGKR